MKKNIGIILMVLLFLSMATGLGIAIGCLASVEAAQDGDSAFDLAVQEGFTGDLDAWLESLKGDNGKEIELSVKDGAIKWSYKGEDSWKELVKVSDLVGAAGKDGAKVEFQKTETHLQFRYVDANGAAVSEWANLLTLADLIGADGKDGREVAFQVTATHIQYGYKDAAGNVSQWVNLIELSKLTGAAGQNGANGSNGANGADGKEVVIEVKDGAIKWQYKGETEWKTLVSLEALKGANGADGADGADGKDGKEVTFQVTDTEILYGYADENGEVAEWKTLVDLKAVADQFKEKFEVEFIVDGEVIDTKEVLEGQKVEKPADPAKEGYTFVGWYVGDEKWVFSGHPVTENTQLVAKWSAFELVAEVVDGKVEYAFVTENAAELENVESVTLYVTVNTKEVVGLEAAAVNKDVTCKFGTYGEAEGDYQTYYVQLGWITGTLNVNANDLVKLDFTFAEAVTEANVTVEAVEVSGTGAYQDYDYVVAFEKTVLVK